MPYTNRGIYRPRGPSQERTCPICGRPFKVWASAARSRVARFCSKSCSNRARALPLSRFWERVDQTGGPDACWPWLAGRNSQGYGSLRVAGKSDKAHRVAFRLHYGGIPGGFVICHHCDNPPCCNPAHLFAAPEIENIRDRDRKGRGRLLRGHGEDLSFSRATEAVVRELRARHAAGESGASLARRFDLSERTVYDIWTRRTWKHVP